LPSDAAYAEVQSGDGNQRRAPAKERKGAARTKQRRTSRGVAALTGLQRRMALAVEHHRTTGGRTSTTCGETRQLLADEQREEADGELARTSGMPALAEIEGGGRALASLLAGDRRGRRRAG
jgi:hypothetical protein